MLPRLEAEEQLMRIAAASLGSGQVKQRDARRAIDQLERAVHGGRRATAKATPDMLAAIGIAVIEVPPASPGVEVSDG
ncbi:hypothetical protein [Phyllobacterium leguminum]|nr:hypothetical protein [Phyllobacterium leguminum]